MSITQKLDSFELSKQGIRLPSELYRIIRNYILDDYDVNAAKSWAFDYLNNSIYENFNNSFDFKKDYEDSREMLDYFQEELKNVFGKGKLPPELKKKIELWIEIIEKYDIYKDDLDIHDIFELMYDIEFYSDIVHTVKKDKDTYIYSYETVKDYNDNMRKIYEVYKLKNTQIIKNIQNYNYEIFKLFDETLEVSNIDFKGDNNIYTDTLLEDLYKQYKEISILNLNTIKNKNMIEEYNRMVDIHNKYAFKYPDILSKYTGPYKSAPPIIS